jgi:hypothetical protein
MNKKSCKYNKIINLKQNKPIIEIKNERTLFSGVLFKNDKKIGVISGWTEEVPNAFNILQLRIRNLYFKLPCGDIIANGLSDVYGNDNLLNDKHYTAITGGTNKYSNITGEILTERNNDETYNHIIYIKYL